MVLKRTTSVLTRSSFDPDAQRSNAACKAARRLMRSGLDCGRNLKSPETIDWLADIARHIGSLDPIEIGAGALLESSGHTRGNEQLTLEVS